MNWTGGGSWSIWSRRNRFAKKLSDVASLRDWLNGFTFSQPAAELIKLRRFATGGRTGTSRTLNREKLEIIKP
jgi:hypothetical protein